LKRRGKKPKEWGGNEVPGKTKGPPKFWGRYYFKKKKVEVLKKQGATVVGRCEKKKRPAERKKKKRTYQKTIGEQATPIS